MRKKIDIEQIATKVDFKALGSKIRERADKAPAKTKRSTLADLLKPIEEELRYARKKKVPYSELVRIVEEAGITISEPTLRHFLDPKVKAKIKKNSKAGGKRTSRKKPNTQPSTSKSQSVNSESVETNEDKKEMVVEIRDKVRAEQGNIGKITAPPPASNETASQIEESGNTKTAVQIASPDASAAHSEFAKKPIRLNLLPKTKQASNPQQGSTTS